MLRPFVRRVLIVGALLVAVASVPLAGLWWYHAPFGPFLLDGPFRGTPVDPVEHQTPDQAFPLYNGFVLEVYDPSAETESPVVQLRTSDKEVLWSIRADGFEQGDVREIRFNDARRGFARSGRVDGLVKWTHGHERACWFITGDGSLRDYYYSW